MAEAGLEVCLLERGQAYPPGSFPRSPHKVARNFWDPSEGLFGMFNIWSFRKLEALVSSGLGGGSLIYANVLIRKDEKWFVKEDIQHGGHEHWPVTRADLDPHYDNVERMLGAQRYPFQHKPYDQTPKTIAFREVAGRLNLEWQLPNLAVTFANPGATPIPGEPIEEQHRNMHGRTRYTCRLCGECDIGCNYGSKNTLDFNYLSETKRLGAEVRTLCEVRSFAPLAGGGYRVDYVEHDPGARAGQRFDTSQLDMRTVTADRLVLSAGTLGSTFLLLKNRHAFPGVRQALGTRFGGNGDLLGFAFNSRRLEPSGRGPRLLDAGYGPVITSALRVPDALDGGEVRGHYVEDSGYPEYVNWVVEGSNAPGALPRFLGFVLRRLRERASGRLQSDLSAEVARLFGRAELSSSSMALLGMGRDVPDGMMGMDRNGFLRLDWQIRRSSEFFEALSGTMAAIAGALNAEFAVNPTYRFNRVVTVHPLGGCPMGRNEAEGVVDSYGEVYNHPGFFIADGSVMPGPVGPNPSLTIAALADRFADRMTAKRRERSEVMR